MPANPLGQLEVTLCRREMDSRESAIPIWPMQEWGASQASGARSSTSPQAGR